MKNLSESVVFDLAFKDNADLKNIALHAIAITII